MVKGNKGKIDNLGRIVIPKSIRKALDIDPVSYTHLTLPTRDLV